jgi:putative molybdopterin biosynthesis protein
MYGLGFLPVAPEHYDFLVADRRRVHAAVAAFLSALSDEPTRARIRALGMDLD